jgi:hypothetical protein
MASPNTPIKIMGHKNIKRFRTSVELDARLVKWVQERRDAKRFTSLQHACELGLQLLKESGKYE